MKQWEGGFVAHSLVQKILKHNKFYYRFKVSFFFGTEYIMFPKKSILTLNPHCKKSHKHYKIEIYCK